MRCIKGTTVPEHKYNAIVFMRYDNTEKPTNSGPFISINGEDDRNSML